MRINKENYEEYYLDYLENNLDEQLREEMEAFLLINPELEIGDTAFLGLNTIENKQHKFELPEKLFREEETGLTKWDYLLIADLEGELEGGDKEKLEHLKSDESFSKDYSYYQKTKLIKDETIVFEGKEKLKKTKVIVLPYFRYAAAVAAILLAFFSIYPGAEKQYQPRGLANLEPFEVESKPLVLEKASIKENLKTELTPVSTSPVQEKTFAENQVNQEETDVKEIPLIEDEPQEVLADIEENSVDEEILEKSTQEFDQVLEQGEESSDLAEVSQKDTKPSSKNDEGMTIKEYARLKLLKNKSLSETISEELAEATDEKITFKSKKSDKGGLEAFALNIGSFSISKK